MASNSPEKLVSRPGIMTTEFLSFVLLCVMILASGLPFMDIPGEHIAMLFGAGVAYTGGRQWLKQTVAKNGSTSTKRELS